MKKYQEQLKEKNNLLMKSKCCKGCSIHNCGVGLKCTSEIEKLSIWMHGNNKYRVKIMATYVQDQTLSCKTQAKYYIQSVIQRFTTRKHITKSIYCKFIWLIASLCY